MYPLFSSQGSMALQGGPGTGVRLDLVEMALE
jgi:hypothetical protein